MNIFKCDSCGVETEMNPPSEPVFTSVEDKEGYPKRIPKMVKQKRQGSDGQVIEVEVQETRYLRSKTYIVSLAVGDERIQRDFCRTCLDDKVLGPAKIFWSKLETIQSR